MEVKDTILKIKKTKSEIKKELEDSIANGKRNENTDIQQMVENRVANEEDATKVIREFEEIIKLVSAIFIKLLFFSPNDSPSKTIKSAFYFI